jgi:hypothetical protein
MDNMKDVRDDAKSVSETAAFRVMVDEVKDVIMGSENNKVRQAEFS